MDSSRNSVFKTLLYFDIFEYPLTKEQIWQFLNKKISRKDFENSLKDVSNKNSFYFLKGKIANISKRKKREGFSAPKIERAEEVAKKLSFIPTLHLIGISGSLSMKNSDEDDDIDIFIISKTGFVWFTRLLLAILLKLLGVYRSQQEKNVKNKFCLNFVIGEDKMTFNKKKRNLYLAHEIVQLLPVFQRDNTYKKFIKNNNWIYKFLPNSKEKIIKNNNFINRKSTASEKTLVMLLNLLYIENLSRFFQYIYMKPKITSEKIENDVLAFHPKSYENLVLKKFNSRSKYDTRGH